LGLVFVQLPPELRHIHARGRVGWRQIIENMHKTAGLAEWYKEHGRHPVYAKGKPVPGISKKHTLSLPIVQAILEADADAPPAPAASPYLIEEEEGAAV
jgi:hypothetical protein